MPLLIRYHVPPWPVTNARLLAEADEARASVYDLVASTAPLVPNR